MSKFFEKIFYEVFIEKKELPEKIFLEDFNKFLFFDLDINSSKNLLLGVYRFLEKNSEKGNFSYIFSYSKKSFLKKVAVNEKWVGEVIQTGSFLREEDDYYGLIIIGDNKKWAIFQSSPVDIGVFAFNSNEDLRELDSSFFDCFFDCSDISSWMECFLKSEKSPIHELEYGFFKELLKNYS